MNKRLRIVVTRTTTEIAIVYANVADLPPKYDVGKPDNLTQDDATLIGKRIVKKKIFGIPGVDAGKYAKSQELEWEPLEESPIQFHAANFVEY